MSTKTSRYTLYRYGDYHFAIDCEDCDRKIANLRPERSSAFTVDRINDHEVKYHGQDAQSPST